MASLVGFRVATSAPALGLTRTYAIGFATITLVLVVAPFLIYPIFLMKVLCFALFACAFNIMIGYGGLLSFGHAAFFGMASYVTAHAAKEWGVTPELAILAGVVVATAIGAVVGFLAIRREGIYFAMITLAFAQMVYFFCIQTPFTGGEDGLQAVPRGHLFGLVDLERDMAMYWFVAAVFIASVLFLFRVVHSPFGQVLKALREHEPRAMSLGYEAVRYKLIAFTLSAAFSGLAGSMKALVFKLASLTDVFWTMSGEVVLMTLLGGAGTIFGPMVGAVVMVTMQNYLAHLGAWVTVVQGAIFLVCVLMFRSGIVGVMQKMTGRTL